jgi:hypothetical protein
MVSEWTWSRRLVGRSFGGDSFTGRGGGIGTRLRLGIGISFLFWLMIAFYAETELASISERLKIRATPEGVQISLAL